MKRSLYFLLILPALLCACGKGTPPKPASLPVMTLSSADIMLARVAPVVDSLPFTGNLDALSSSVVSAEAQGTVLSVAVREGDTVKRGQVLARIDDRVAREAVAEQAAQMANAQSKLALAKIKLEKQRELWQKGFISKLAFDEQSSDFAVAEGESRAQLTQLIRARKVLADSVVHAPIDGVVYQRKINPGEQAQSGASLFSIADLSVLQVTASIPSQWVGHLKPGMQADFTVEGNKQSYQARLTRINPVAMTGTRSFEVYLRVDNASGILRVGQFVQGGIRLQALDNQIALPLSAIHDRDSQPWVMTVAGGKLRRTPVKIVLRSETSRQAAVQGLAPGVPVLVGSLLGLKPGVAVALPADHSK